MKYFADYICFIAICLILNIFILDKNVYALENCIVIHQTMGEMGAMSIITSKSGIRIDSYYASMIVNPKYKDVFIFNNQNKLYAKAKSSMFSKKLEQFQINNWVKNNGFSHLESKKIKTFTKDKLKFVQMYYTAQKIKNPNLKQFLHIQAELCTNLPYPKNATLLFPANCIKNNKFELLTHLEKKIVTKDNDGNIKKVEKHGECKTQDISFKMLDPQKEFCVPKGYKLCKSEFEVIARSAFNEDDDN